jgi:hypothetical protein
MKKYCEVHHLFYSSISCPCCIQDKASALEKKHVVKEKKTKAEEPVDLNESLKALQKKFNVKL